MTPSKFSISITELREGEAPCVTFQQVVSAPIDMIALSAILNKPTPPPEPPKRKRRADVGTKRVPKEAKATVADKYAKAEAPVVEPPAPVGLPRFGGGLPPFMKKAQAEPVGPPVDELAAPVAAEAEVEKPY